MCSTFKSCDVAPLLNVIGLLKTTAANLSTLTKDGNKMWQFESKCTPEDSNLFFSELASKVIKAKMICLGCPVQNECLDFAIKNNIEEGIFGGLTFNERKSLVLA